LANEKEGRSVLPTTAAEVCKKLFLFIGKKVNNILKRIRGGNKIYGTNEK